ncbi:DUF2752 domain-containing protein [Xanthomarina sp. F2636L]|uniref:DUF2752 domain-containing protein n=1 Tax=Xanthomarina sp. F2636L TaxID=2996018 RepID=UPI00225DEF8E|nr:DUF2752 domain-containing protein [Xanthomarina sp. F2636L]MCX7550426.1 DUF2752 domain-containing protein [Xanthomarina sp. F2636L]
MSSIEDFMLPCLNKQLFGVDCLGCGFQRAFMFLIKGDFTAALIMYPAIYTLILLGIFLIYNFYKKFKYDYQLKMGLIFLNVLIIVGSYIFKITH